MKEINSRIINAVMEKARTVCPGALDLFGVYGSAATDDEYEKSDLDLLIVVNDEKGLQLADCFILDDSGIGYDLYCTSWEMLEAECSHAHLSKLLDSQIVYYRDDKAADRLQELRKRAVGILASETRYERAETLLDQAKQEYAEVCFTDDLSKVRTHAGKVIYCLMDAIMLFHGTYFKLGTKRTFEEMEKLALPFDIREAVMNVLHASTVDAIRTELTEMFLTVRDYLDCHKGRKLPSVENISGTYEEMVSNWKNKMSEAVKRSDMFSSFMNLASLQLMIHEIAGGIATTDFEIMDQFSPDDLTKNVEVFDETLSKYLEEYKRLGMSIRHFSNIESFLENYFWK